MRKCEACLAFYRFFATSLITIWNHIFGAEKFKILSLCMQHRYEHNYIKLLMSKQAFSLVKSV